MTEMVSTMVGDLPRDELTYEDHITENEYAVQTTRVWFHAGEKVRQDAWVDIKQPPPMATAKGN